jgi:hypothetical protein
VRFPLHDRTNAPETEVRLVTVGKIAGIATAVALWAGLTLAFLATTNTTCADVRAEGGGGPSGIASKLCGTGTMPSPLLMVVALFVLVAVLWRSADGIAVRLPARAVTISLIVYLALYAVSVHIVRGH